MKTKVLTALTVLALVLSGCSSPMIAGNQIIGLQPGTALMIVKDAANGCTGCFVFAKQFANGSMGYIFAKPFQEFWGFVLMGGNQEAWSNFFNAGVGGNAANLKTFTEFVKAASDSGWVRINPQQIPPWIKTVSGVATSAYNSIQYASRVVTTAGSACESLFFISVPLDAFTNSDVQGVRTDN